MRAGLLSNLGHRVSRGRTWYTTRARGGVDLTSDGTGAPRKRERGRHGRALLGWLSVALCALGAVLVAGPTSAQEPSVPDAARGGELYQRWCATCHATDGTGTEAGPAIDDVSIAYLDLTMRTGRMPLADPTRGVRSREFTADEREAVVAHLTESLDLSGVVEVPPPGDPAAGRQVYSVSCAQCHGATGKGGIAGGGVVIPPVLGLDATTIAAATRVGPFQMPRFGEDVVSDAELGDMIAYIEHESGAATTPIGLAEVDMVQSAGLSALLVGAVLVVTLWAGSRRRAGSAGRGDGDD